MTAQQECPDDNAGAPNTEAVPKVSDSTSIAGQATMQGRGDRKAEHAGPLSDEHLAMLAASGITREHAALRGYATFAKHNRFDLIALGFSQRQVKRLSWDSAGLLIPQLDVNGQVWGHQLRLDWEERFDRPGELQKYETPHGQRNGLDVPPGVGELLGAPEERLWIVEGSKKADCAALHGLCVISVSGVWNWRGTNRYGGKVTLPDWNDLALDDREVVIAYDGDVARKEQVRKAMAGLAGWLKTVKRARVSCLWLPDTDSKTGIDDFLANGGTVIDLEQMRRPFDFRLDGDPGQAKRSMSSTLVDLAREVYSLGITGTDDPFGVRKGSHVALMLRGGRTGLRAELARRYFNEHNTAASQQALADACVALEGFACQTTPRPVYLRVAESADTVYIDLGDPEENAIRIMDGTWNITTWIPVLFRRTKLTTAMPKPVAGGDLSQLWKFVPANEEDRSLLLAWLVAALIQPDAAHTILALLAEHGSIKSTATRFLVTLIDPTEVPVRKLPRNAEEWVTSAYASWVIGLDNLSGTIPLWLSDCLCRASTGDGDVRRQLYTDQDVSVVAFRRVVVFNGVDVIITQGDLADRLLRVRLPRVKDADRLTDAQAATGWTEAHPHILGGLLDLAARVHLRLRTIKVSDMPRMADFARVLACVDEELGTDGLGRYRLLSKRTAAETLDAPFIAALIVRRYRAMDTTAKDILRDLTPADPGWRAPPGWPKGAQMVSAQLTRHAPALRSQGWTVDNDGAHSHQNVTLWTIEPPPGEEALWRPSPRAHTLASFADPRSPNVL